MTAQQIPTTVADLIARVTQTTGNVAKHRQAMSDVAAIAAANRQTPTQEGGKAE